MRIKIKLKLLFWVCGVAITAFLGSCQADELKKNFYKKSCPLAEEIVRNITWKHVASNSALPPKLLRMHFHDCFVRGCDASILLDPTPNNKVEKDTPPNSSLEGFNVLEEVKTQLEETCPGVVSCADILTLAARDAVSFQFQRPIWEVRTGRRDGKISSATEALANIPSPLSNFTTLKQEFANKGLTAHDLVVLSGAHTIGKSHCNLFAIRLYNFTGKGDVDPSLNSTYAAFLKGKCKSSLDSTTTVEMDPQSSLSFDNHYFLNLKLQQGLFLSDAGLLIDKSLSHIVDKMLVDENFFREFGQSMKRMGAIGVLTGSSGDIRKKCNLVNS
ncbi:peroxidase 24-like [Macadamia integrifolia]|uniref:peroxidase 24-like n=1 Tax=Macadamia integrifolia TaxID=60698 RepID=UPI001C52EE16|nr:peroxidase 24-like [Macadamia integrifolia]